MTGAARTTNMKKPEESKYCCPANKLYGTNNKSCRKVQGTLAALMSQVTMCDVGTHKMP